jgi:hypothetical protein
MQQIIPDGLCERVAITSTQSINRREMCLMADQTSTVLRE